MYALDAAYQVYLAHGLRASSPAPSPDSPLRTDCAPFAAMFALSPSSSDVEPKLYDAFRGVSKRLPTFTIWRSTISNVKQTTIQRPASTTPPPLPPIFSTTQTVSKTSSITPPTTTEASLSDPYATSPPATASPTTSPTPHPPPSASWISQPPSSSDSDAPDSTLVLGPTTSETAISVPSVTSVSSLSRTPQITTVWLASSASPTQDPSGARSGTTETVERIVVAVACVCVLALFPMACWRWKKRRNRKGAASAGGTPGAVMQEQLPHTSAVTDSDILAPTGFLSGGATVIEAREKSPAEIEDPSASLSPGSSGTLSYTDALCPNSPPLTPNSLAGPAPQQSHITSSQPVTSLRPSDTPYQHVRFRPLPVPIPRSGLSCPPEERGSVWSVMEVADAHDSVHSVYGGIGAEAEMDPPPVYSRY
ncbi:hypothetical protein BV20DRAFT_975246 [Pilatotrama ljubarskyi]|nr:hypothetical protein BV20DRAFT_975246 [Pilatotrama ljubarskyi]